MGLEIRRTPPIVLATCWALLILEGYDIVVFGAAVPALRGHTSWHLSQSDIGLIGAITIIGQLVGALVSGTMTDRRGRRPTLLISVTIFTVGMLVCSMAPSAEVFGAGRLIVGLGTGVLLPAAAAMVAEFCPPGRRNFYQGVTFGGIGFGGVLSTAVSLGYGGTDFRMTFLIGALLGVVLLPVLMRWLPESVDYLLARGRRGDAERQLTRSSIDAQIVPSAGPPDSRRPGSWRSLFDPGYGLGTVLFWAVGFMSLLILYGVYTWLPVLMTKAGYNLGSAITFFLVLNLGMVAGSLAVSWLADRFGRRRVLIVLFVSSAAGFAGLAQTPPTVFAYLLVALVGAGALSGQLLINAFVAASYPTQHRGTALGAMLGVGRVGGAIGPVYVSFLLGERFAGAGFYGFAVPAVLASVVIAGQPKRLPRTH